MMSCQIYVKHVVVWTFEEGTEISQICALRMKEFYGFGMA